MMAKIQAMKVLLDIRVGCMKVGLFGGSIWGGGGGLQNFIVAHGQNFNGQVY
jgi:hypothetical protein